MILLLTLLHNQEYFDMVLQKNQKELFLLGLRVFSIPPEQILQKEKKRKIIACIDTLETSLMVFDGSVEPKVLISFPRMRVMIGCDQPLAMAQIVPMVIKATSRGSAKVKSL